MTMESNLSHRVIKPNFMVINNISVELPVDPVTAFRSGNHRPWSHLPTRRKSHGDGESSRRRGGSCLPCTPEEEKQIVEELNREAERDLKWERYVGQGLVDNLDNGKSLESQDLDEPELVRMLREGKDYVLVPKKVWEKLVQWYKGGPTLPRKMISQGVFNKTQFNVEVYPLRLKLIDSRDDSESTIQISKKASLQELYERVCSVRRVEREKASIWDYYNKQKSSQCALSCSSWEDFVKIFCRDFGSHGFEDYYERYSSLFSRDSFPMLSYTGTSQTSNGHRGARFVVREDSDFYSVLGVSKNSSKSEIKSAYQKLARSYHPVVNKEPDAEQKFKEISNAYEVLPDDEKRSLYDRYGEAGLKGAEAFPTLSPPRLKATLTLEWQFLIEETWEGLRLSESQKMLNFPLVGEGEVEVS
ncbi:hypothetical protein DKX38_018841 [Salix brachista]|uniref:J domain-containing protein n=1 Tax=Salix brachista TaxID=2182728 RepID=A0A5N5KPA1_9ROSI|nr:hypothetical protein DKX38_018841 [Salix brachista]